MGLKEYLPFADDDPYGPIADAMADLKGEHDALALLPYDDGTFWFKPCNFDKDLIGGQGGYETMDGDKIVVDGDGEAKREFLGIDIILGVDPTEHAAAVDPIKALVAYKNNIGEWIKVDKKGQVIEAGEAVEAVSDIETGPEQSDMVVEYAQENDVAFDAAVAQLEQQGDISKVFDIAPPGAVVKEDGELEVEQATHIAVDQSKAADLLPTTTSTTELNTALDKARMEEHEEGKERRILIQGLVIGFITSGIFSAVMGALFFFM